MAEPGAKEFVEVKPETAKEFMAAEEARGLSPKTWNDTLKLLRATFKHLHPHLSDGSNPFHGLATKATETVNREPFTVEEMKAILEVCAADDFIRPVIVAEMCTARRRGDCCLLKWKDVDLKKNRLRVKTAETGETVEIPTCASCVLDGILYVMGGALSTSTQTAAVEAYDPRSNQWTTKRSMPQARWFVTASVVNGTVDIGACEFQGPGSMISYAWLQHYGLPTDGSADATDSDADGHNTWQEWRCQTCPTNALSVLRLLSASHDGNNVTLTWQSVAGVSYFLECSTNLAAAPPFTPQATNLPGQTGCDSGVPEQSITRPRKRRCPLPIPAPLPHGTHSPT